MDSRFTKQIADMDARFTKQLETLDSRLRKVELDVAEIKGRKAGWQSALNWVPTGIAIVALAVAISVALS